MKRPSAWVWAIVAGLAIAAFTNAGAALAAAQPWQMDLQPAATLVHQHITSFERFTFWIITVITLFVLALLLYVIFRFNSKANPVPSKTAHNTTIEIIWTVAPIIILVAIAIPSFRLLYEELVIPPADITIKVTGYQWYWGYEYPEVINDKKQAFSFDSVMVAEKDITDKAKQPRLLAVDNEVVVPTGKVVRLQITAADVIHSFAMQPFGIKLDAMPGRLNETWFKVEDDKAGIYYGQCSELCGRDHAFMPIAIRVVTPDQYAKWTDAAKHGLKEANKVLAEIVDENAKKTDVAQR